MTLLDFILWQIAFSALILLFDFGISPSGRFTLNRAILILLPVMALGVLIELHEVSPQLPGLTLPDFTTSAPVLQSTFNWSSFLPWIYLMIGLTYLIFVVWKSFALYISGRPIGKQGSYEIREVSEENYSMFNRIYLTPEDKTNALVIKHEQSHLDQRHTLDLLWVDFLVALCWINPLVWRWKVLVRQNHEYLADSALMKEDRVQAREYMHLLLDRALNTNQFTLGNYFSLNSLISKRITMINKKQKQHWVKTAGISLLMISSVALISACDKNSQAEDSKQNTQLEADEAVYKKVDKYPQFKGGQKELYAYLGQTVKYPAKCKEEKIEGRAIVRFVVDESGNIGNAEVVKSDHDLFSEEALRVVNTMPAWEPGTMKGEAVKVEMALPFQFTMPVQD